jgi:FkbM family methyltransferase
MTAIAPRDLTAYLAELSEPERELMKLFSPDAALTICDIGACEGEDSIRYGRRFPQARVFAFEPLPANQAVVRANFARYGAARAELVPLALSDRTGEATFHVSSGKPREEWSGPDWNYGNKSSSLLPPAGAEPMHGWIEFKETVTVRTETLDRFCRERAIDRIDFIHMDVQGAEHLVLQGAVAMLPRITALWLEVSDQQLYRGQKLRGEIESFMRGHGFRLGFESRREVEGDQFYVNQRLPLAWRYLATRRLRSFAGRVRRRLFP